MGARLNVFCLFRSCLLAAQVAAQRISTVTPVSIFQVMSADVRQDETFHINGREVSQVCACFCLCLCLC
jgi:hypothetical protein